MKRLFKNLLVGVLAVVMISGSAFSTSAYYIERISAYDTCDNNSCDNGTCAEVQREPDARCLRSLCDFLRRLGCSDSLCIKLQDVLNSRLCSDDPDPTCDTCIPSEATEVPENNTYETNAQPVTEATEPVSTELPAQKPTEAPTQPSAEPPTEVATENNTEAVEERPTEAEYQLNEYELEVVRLINEIRSEYGLSVLSIDLELSKVARLKAKDMYDNRYFDHNSPTYGSPFDMMRGFGISYRTAGENIAMGYRSPQSVVNGWMNSEGHRRNILNAGFKKIGMGYISDGSYWSQMFIG